MKGVELLMYERDGIVLFREELQGIIGLGALGRKDAAAILQAKARWEQRGFQPSGSFDFRPIEGRPYEPKLWEARLRKSVRADGVHGYRIFYVQTRRPSTGRQVAVLLMLWGKAGRVTPSKILDEAWRRASDVLKNLAEDSFFCPPDGTGSY